MSKEVVIVASMVPMSTSMGTMLDRLGGTVKIGKILPPHTTVEQWIRSRKTEGRIIVGVSVYKAADGVSNAQCADTLRALHREVLSAKRVLKEEGRSLRLVSARERMLPSVALVTEHILERGGEFVALISHQGVQLGETLAVQAFHEYRHRDRGRPRRDMRRGMLPPKIAQMMVNLAGVQDGGLILDPFCGSGTVLSEAALLGYRTVGSDISKEAIRDAEKNFQFLISNVRSHSLLQSSDHTFFTSDVRHLPTHLEKHSIDAIVTEPYLGPPFTGREKPEQLAKIRQKVLALLVDAFQSFHDVLRPNGRVVLVLPVLGGKLIPIGAIEKRGWRLVAVVPRIAKNLSGSTARGTILYHRPDQHLAREIAVWTRS